jgi:hypothetical protein
MSNHEAYPGYRSLSSVARVLLPRAERMHTEGKTWRQIAQELRVSYTALHIWRRLGQDGNTQEREEESLGQGMVV